MMKKKFLYNTQQIFICQHIILFYLLMHYTFFYRDQIAWRLYSENFLVD